MSIYRNKTVIPANGSVDNILQDLRIRYISLDMINGALVSFAALLDIEAPNTTDPGAANRPSLQAFIGGDQVIEYALPGVFSAEYGTGDKPARRGPELPTDMLFGAEPAMPGDLIRITALGRGTAATLQWLLNVEEVV